MQRLLKGIIGTNREAFRRDSGRWGLVRVSRQSETDRNQRQKGRQLIVVVAEKVIAAIKKDNKVSDIGSYKHNK